MWICSRTLWVVLLASVGCQPPVSDPNGGQAVTANADESFQAAREEMVEKQLAMRDIQDERVLKAMKDVPRHRFVPEAQRGQAYDDSPLPIGFGQTISQPYIVAFMTQTLKLKPTDRVLEIGTGSGYQAAILAQLVDDVYSVEIVEPLAERAKETLAKVGIENVHVRAGDGYQGWEEHAPYDAIIVTCAPDDIPQALVDQLAEGGRMVIPVGRAFAAQELVLLEKRDGEITRRGVLPVRFVPMTGGEER